MSLLTPNRLFTLGLAALALGACAPKEYPLIPLEEVCERGEYGKTVRTAGFLTGPGGSMMCDSETCEMAISNRGIGGTTSIRIDVRLGSGANTMTEPPDSYRNADLVVRDSEGNPHNVGDWIVVQGRILNEQACLITPVSRVFAGTAPTAGGSGAPAPSAGSGAAAAPPAGQAPAIAPPAQPGAAPAGDNKPGTEPPAPVGDKPGAAAPAAEPPKP